MKLPNARKAIQSLPLYQRSLKKTPLREEKTMDLIQLASNENALGTPPEVIDAIQQEFSKLHRYPDGEAESLISALGQLHDHPEELIVLGTGSDQIISLLLNAYAVEGDNIITGAWTFPRFAQSATHYGVECRGTAMTDFTFDPQAMLTAVDEKTRLVFIANPNNPTGTILTHQQLSDFLFQLPSHVIPVIDEAYYDFVTDSAYADSLKLLKTVKNRPMVILRSFSKNYGLAGMRIGYAVVSDAKIASSLQHLRGTFNVGHLAQTAAFAALKLSNWLPYVREFHQKEKEKLYRVFEKLTIPYIMSQANFLLFSLGGNGRATVKAFEQRGIVLRAMADWKMPEEWVRLTIGSEQENDKFVSILEEILREQK